MNPTHPREVVERLRALGHAPNPLLGQNFLIDANIRNLIVDTAQVREGERVLEIGPGFGVLTGCLLERGARVVAVEKDPVLHAFLREEFGGHPRLELILSDFLDLNPGRWARSAIDHVVANLPYSSGSRMVVELTQLTDPPPDLTLTVQWEVAERLAAPAGTRQRGLLGVWAQRWYRVRIVKAIAGSCFYPVPEVKSAVVRLERADSAVAEGPRLAAFGRVLKAAFSQRRKQIRGILGQVTAPGLLPLEPEAVERVLKAVGIDARSRPEVLTGDQWRDLTDALLAERGPDGFKESIG